MSFTSPLGTESPLNPHSFMSTLSASVTDSQKPMNIEKEPLSQNGTVQGDQISSPFSTPNKKRPREETKSPIEATPSPVTKTCTRISQIKIGELQDLIPIESALTSLCAAVSSQTSTPVRTRSRLRARAALSKHFELDSPPISERLRRNHALIKTSEVYSKAAREFLTDTVVGADVQHISGDPTHKAYTTYDKKSGQKTVRLKVLGGHFASDNFFTPYLSSQNGVEYGMVSIPAEIESPEGKRENRIAKSIKTRFPIDGTDYIQKITEVVNSSSPLAQEGEIRLYDIGEKNGMPSFVGVCQTENLMNTAFPFCVVGRVPSTTDKDTDKDHVTVRNGNKEDIKIEGSFLRKAVRTKTPKFQFSHKGEDVGLVDIGQSINQLPSFSQVSQDLYALMPITPKRIQSKPRNQQATSPTAAGDI